MKILDRMSVIRAMIPTRGEAHDLALRWKKAARVEPELAGDLIRLGGVLSIQPDEYRGGLPSDAAIDPLRAAYQKHEKAYVTAEQRVRERCERLAAKVQKGATAARISRVSSRL